MRTSRNVRRRLPRQVLVALAFAAIVLGGLLLSTALFSASTATDDNLLEIGTVDVATAPVTLDLDAGALAPGDVVATPLQVRNDGSLELRYSVSSTVDDVTLGDLLEFEVRTGVTRCDAVGADGDGVLVAGPVPLGGLTAEPVVGDPATGDDPGDRVLAAGGSEVLCLRVELPPGVDEDTAAGLTVTASLTIDAEQTAANP